MRNQCSVDGCSGLCVGRGLCDMHYRRNRRHGDVTRAWPNLTGQVHGTWLIAERGPTLHGNNQHYWIECTECGHRKVARGMRVVEGNIRCDNCILTYANVHQRLNRERGRAADRSCIECGLAASDWAYQHNDPDERVETISRGGKSYTVHYGLDFDSYAPMCHRCHVRLDKRTAKSRREAGVFVA